MLPVGLNDKNLEGGILIVNHVLFHRHAQQLPEASFVTSDLFIGNRVILLFLKESTMLCQRGRVACSLGNWGVSCVNVNNLTTDERLQFLFFRSSHFLVSEGSPEVLGKQDCFSGEGDFQKCEEREDIYCIYLINGSLSCIR